MASFTEHPQGIAAMLRSDDMQAAMRRKAERGKTYAEAIAPVRTGRYRANFRVWVGVRAGLAWARLYNPTPYARFLEWGTRYMRRQRILGRAMDAIRK